MKPYQRVEIALQGGRPDRVPIVPIYDIGYIYNSQGRDLRDFYFATPDEYEQIFERSFLQHKVDGLFVHRGKGLEWQAKHRVEKGPGPWRVTDLETGKVEWIHPDGLRTEEDGRILLAHSESQIESFDDLDRVLDPIPSEEEIEASGSFWPLRFLTQKYPVYHFSFQIGSPMVSALNACGGFEAGLVTMATNRPLFAELLCRCAERQIAYIAPGKAAGGRSAWFTSYFTGADTISPRDYASLVFPYEQQVCQAARDQGLYVLNWFLGDLMPILDTVMQLPIDALVLEQGRKGYEIDPVSIRERVGPTFCLFGFGLERDFCDNNRESLSAEIRRQIAGAGKGGAFIAGTPIMPPDARPEAVDYYFEEARRWGNYGSP